LWQGVENLGPCPNPHVLLVIVEGSYLPMHWVWCLITDGNRPPFPKLYCYLDFEKLIVSNLVKVLFACLFCELLDIIESASIDMLFYLSFSRESFQM
jgi:hypothetical protein